MRSLPHTCRYSYENAPIQKELEAREVGNAAAFLLSPLASAITGGPPWLLTQNCQKPRVVLAQPHLLACIPTGSPHAASATRCLTGGAFGEGRGPTRRCPGERMVTLHGAC